MRGRKLNICIAGFFLATLLVEGDCRADFSLHPGIYLRLEATDNLYLSDVNRNQELITTIAPSIRLEQTGKLLNLELEYAYEMYRFLNEPSLNDRVDTHLGSLDGAFFPERAFNVLLHGDASLANLDWRRSDVIDSPTVNTTNRYTGLIRPTYRFTLGARHSGELAYVYEVVKYDYDLADNTQSNRVDLMLERRQSARLDFRLTGFYEHLIAKISHDYDRLQGMAGGEWRPSSATTLFAMGGVTWFEYETGENFNTRVYDCWLRYAPARRWAVDASYLKNFAYDIQDGLYRLWQGAAGVSYSGRLSWRLGLFIRINEYVRVDRDDREQGVVGEATYQLTPKVVLGLNGDSRRLEFEPVSEMVDRYSVGVSIEYAPRDFVTMGCRYTYRNNDSDIEVRDYVENRADCNIRLTYPLIP